MPRGRLRDLGPSDLAAAEFVDRIGSDPRIRQLKRETAANKTTISLQRSASYPASAGQSTGGSDVANYGRDFGGFVDGTPTPGEDEYFNSVSERNLDYDEVYLVPLWYEVVNARGSKATITTRLDVSLNADGTLKQVVDDSKIVTSLSPSSIDLSQTFAFESDVTVAGYLRIKSVSGAPAGGDGSDGDMVQDEGNDLLYMKCDGTWKSVEFTA